MNHSVEQIVMVIHGYGCDHLLGKGDALDGHGRQYVFRKHSHAHTNCWPFSCTYQQLGRRKLIFPSSALQELDETIYYQQAHEHVFCRMNRMHESHRSSLCHAQAADYSHQRPHLRLRLGHEPHARTMVASRLRISPGTTTKSMSSR